MYLRALSSALAALSILTFVSPGQQTAPQPISPARQPSQPSGLIIESFSSASAFAVGTQPVAFVATIRNTGNSPVPAGLFTARISCLAGLEYTEGDTRPRLPELAPNAAVTFRWSLRPSAPDLPLVASVALESPGIVPDARVAGIQHFVDGIPSESTGFSKQATARSNRSGATLENANVRLRIYFSEASIPALLLSARTATGWRRVGTSLPAAEVLSAEGGQRPWWELLRVDSINASATTTDATLRINGRFGLRWRGTLFLSLKTDSSVVDARLQLVPLKPVKLSGIRLCPLLAGEGSFGASTTESMAPEAFGSGTLCALRWGVVTTGAAWPDGPNLDGWKSYPLINPEGADYRLIGAEWRPEGQPSNLNSGNLIELRTRLFAFTPSATINDARKVVPPARTAP